MVHPLPGMTRDRHFSDAVYRMRPYTVIDTGGYESDTESSLLSQMRMQSVIAMEEADVVIFLTAVAEPDDPVDEEILRRLRTSGKPFFLAVNKIDKGGRHAEAQAYADFSKYGLNEIFPISAVDGAGVYDLLDQVTDSFEEWDPDEEEMAGPTINVAIVGRQNVGKSTLLNRLLGEERVIANPMAGTTRDAIDAEVSVGGQDFIVIDTAGIRRRGKIERGPEKLSVHSSFRAIDRAHVAILVLDGQEGITAQDTHVASYILERRKACVIVVNKWDMIANREAEYTKTIRSVREHFNFMPWAPVMTISAKTGQRTNKIWELIKHCAENFRKEFSTSELNLILKKATTHQSPPTHKGNAPTFKYVTQTGSMPPTFSFFVNDPKFVHFSYRRFLTNQYYAQLGIEGTPLILRFRRKAPPRNWELSARSGGARDPNRKMLGAGQNFYAGAYSDDKDNAQEIDLSAMPDFEAEQYAKMYYEDDDSEDDGDDE
ncbi:ribosome biogenesis GTPase Der [soil metagenome]